MEGGLVGEGKGRRVEGKGKAAGREGRAVGREGVRWWEGVHRLLGGQCWRRDHHGGREVGGRSRKAREARSIGRALRREARLQWVQRGTREGAHAGMGRASGGQRHWRQRGWRRQPRAESAIVASESCLWMPQSEAAREGWSRASRSHRRTEESGAGSTGVGAGSTGWLARRMWPRGEHCRAGWRGGRKSGNLRGERARSTAGPGRRSARRWRRRWRAHAARASLRGL